MNWPLANARRPASMFARSSGYCRMSSIPAAGCTTFSNHRSCVIVLSRLSIPSPLFCKSATVATKHSGCIAVSASINNNNSAAAPPPRAPTDSRTPRHTALTFPAQSPGQESIGRISNRPSSPTIRRSTPAVSSVHRSSANTTRRFPYVCSRSDSASGPIDPASLCAGITTHSRGAPARRRAPASASRIPARAVGSSHRVLST